MVSEASTANVHMVAGGQLHTPPLDSGILAGVTRTLLLEAAKEAGIPVVERPLPADDIRSAEEVLLTGSVREIAPVTHVDGVAVGSDRPGPVTALLTRAFDDACERQAARDQLGISALGLA